MNLVKLKALNPSIMHNNMKLSSSIWALTPTYISTTQQESIKPLTFLHFG
jgi:hypothetical protein